MILEFLRLSIHQTYAQIGVDTHLARADITSPQGELSIHSSSANMDIVSPRGQLEVDSSVAWSALGKTPTMQWNNSIYSQVKDIALQAIAKIVEDGNRMATITNPNNAIAEIAQDTSSPFSEIQYVGEASYLNMKMQYQANPVQINVEPQKADIQYKVNKPEVQYQRGKVDVYMKNMNSIEMHVSQYDIYK
ncbi:MAG: hypothetical protein JWM44_828 [Bacilli bacterium]|nr:hypothetical protein [Bacilli bacterium]